VPIKERIDEEYIYIFEYYTTMWKSKIMSFFSKIEETGDHHVKQNNPDSERQISHVVSNMWNVDF
jgi:hypothetical protein